jgi:hypothetical protein
VFGDSPSEANDRVRSVEIVLWTGTPDRIVVVLPAAVYAKYSKSILLIWVLAVVEFGEVPAIIVTVFSADRAPF